MIDRTIPFSHVKVPIPCLGNAPFETLDPLRRETNARFHSRDARLYDPLLPGCRRQASLGPLGIANRPRAAEKDLPVGSLHFNTICRAHFGRIHGEQLGRFERDDLFGAVDSPSAEVIHAISHAAIICACRGRPKACQAPVRFQTETLTSDVQPLRLQQPAEAPRR
jgi:hypothetical protein